MATRIDEVIDLVTKKTYSIPIGTEIGMKRMKSAVKSSLCKNILEDEYSIVKNVDFSIIEETIDDNKEFGEQHLYVDVMPKLDVRQMNIGKVNLRLADALKLERINLNSHDGVQKCSQYQMPVRKISKNKINECHLVYNIRGGRLSYPSIKSYHSPIIKFDCYANMSFGKEVVKMVHGTLLGMIEGQRTR